MQKKNRFIVLLSTFLVSTSLFLYQVVLTRIYSVLLWYHYVFLITSFAIFGLGIGGIIAYKHYNKQKSDKKKRRPHNDSNLHHVVLMLTITYITVLGLVYALPFTGGMILYIILGTIPFVFGGYFFAVLFREFAYISSKLYFADLVGSGIGSILVMFSLNYLGMLRTVFLICLIASTAFLLMGSLSHIKKRYILVLPIMFAAAFLLPRPYVSKIEQNFNGLVTNSGKTLGRITKAGETGRIVYTKWNAFSRTDVIQIKEDPNQMLVTIDGAANAPMYKFDGKVDSLEKYKKELEYLPFAFGNNNSTLIIGPGGGRDLLYALAGQSKDITAVEINTSSIDAVNQFKDFNGNIYGRPEVRVYGEDGRNYIRKTNDKYDVIFLSLVMTSTSQGVGFALSENYIYTVNAMKEYLQHLNQGGRIAFLAHDQQDMSKIVATAILALKNQGIPVKDTPKHIAIFRKNLPQDQHGEEHIHTPMVIIKMEPFTHQESMFLVEYAQKNGQLPLFAPHIYEDGPLHHIKEEHISMTEFLNGFHYNISPATDDRPYFYNFAKGVPPVLLFILVIVIIGSFGLFIPYVTDRKALKSMVYFSSLGVGFMLIEIPLIQKFILYLGHPLLAFTYVLAALLIGCGLGSLVSSFKLFHRTLKNIYIPPILVIVINIALIGTLNIVFEGTSHWSLLNRILISTFLVIVQGFFMGMPFPRGMKLLSKHGKSHIIPIMWGINGVMSVAGSVLAIIISMVYGFNVALVAGIIVYLFVGIWNRL